MRGHDHVVGERADNVVKQRRAVDRRGQGFGFVKRDGPPLLAVAGAVEAEFGPLRGDQTVEQRGAQAQRLGGGLTLALVHYDWELREPLELDVIVGRRARCRAIAGFGFALLAFVQS